MKRLAILIILSVLSITANAQVQSDRERDRLLGPVQSVATEISEPDYKDGKRVDGPRVPQQTITYDVRGNRIKRVDFNRDGSVVQTFVYNYNTEGRNVGYEDYVTGLDTPRKHIYILDEKGNRVEYRMVQPTGKDADEKYVFKYNAEGNLVAEELYHKTALVSRNENTYDQQGRLISQISYNPDSTVSSRTHVSFTADGKPLERTRHDGDILTYRVRYTYDKKKRLVEVETTGSFVELDASSENHLTGKVVYIYKGKDQPREMLIYNENGSLRELVSIDYDSHGNWTKRTHRVKTQPANNSEGIVVTRQTEHRTITYQ